MFKRTRTGFWLILLIVAVVGHVLPCRCENLDGGTGDGGVGWFLRAIFGSQAEHQFQSSAGHGRLRRGTSKGCRQTIQADSGYIRSPGFPSSYRPNLLCEWTIQVPARKQILMRFILLDVRGGASGKCTEQEDYLMIRDGTKSGRHLGIFCSPSPNSGQPSPIVSITIVTELRQQTVADTSRVSLFTTQQRNGFSPSFPSKPILEPHKEQSQSQPFSDTQMKSITEQPLQTPTGDASQPKTGEQTKSPDLSPSVTASQLTRSFMMEPHTAELSTELPRVTLKESYVSTEVPVTASEQTSRMTTKQPLVTTKEQLALSFYGDARSVPTTGQQFTLIKGSPTTSYWNKIDHHTLTGAETLPFTKRQDQTQIRTKPLTDQLNAGEFQTHFTTLSPIFTAKPIEAFTATEQLKSTNSQPLVPPTHYQQPLQTFGKHTTGQQNTGVMPVLTQPRSITQGQSHIEQESTSESVTQRDTQPSTEGHTTHQQVSSPLELFPFGQTPKIITNRGAIPQQELQPSTQIASADQEGILLTKLQLFTRTQKPMRQLTHQQTEADFKPQLLTQTPRPTEQSMSTHQQVGTEPEYQSVTLREHKTLLTQLPLRASNTMTHTRGGGEAQTIKPWDFDTKLDRPSGELQSPNYPDAYPMGVHYRWNITVSPRGVIVLNFTDFDLDSAPNNNSSCDERYAYIKVEDEGGIEHVFCGHKIPPLVVSTLNKLIITFVSSYGYGKGFHALYLMQKTKDRVAPPDVSTSEHVCGGGFHQPSGRIQSPNFPDDFQTGIRCHWNITVDVGQVIIINFTAFDLDSVPVDKWCSERYAHVKIVDGIGGNSWTYCGQELPPVFVSSSNTISITYESEFGYSGGFSAVYSVSQMDRASASTPPKAQIPPLLTTRPLYDCGGYRTASRGVIQSPNLPEELELGVNCKWIITAPVGQHIVLNFTNFVMDSAPIEDGQCDERYSHVKVSEGQTDGTGMEGIFCDQKRPPSVVSSSNILTVTFSSGYGYGYGIGFRAEYFMQEVEDRVVIPDTSTSGQMCGGSFYQPSGRIQSPNFLDFQTEISCHWNITVQVGQVIVLNFTVFDLDSVSVDDWCSERYAHVKIVDGIGGSSSTYCGQELPPVFISSSNTISIMYISDFGYGGNFLALYTASAPPKVFIPPPTGSGQPDQCGGVLNQPEGVIFSPWLPDNLETSISCVWNITVATGKVIVLNFTDFNLDSVPVDNWCDESYAYVKIVDQSGSSIYCGQEAPPILVSSSNTVLVYFKSGYGYSRGFRAYYESVQTVDSRGIFETRSTSMPHQPQVPPVATERSYSCGGNLGGPSGIIGAPEYHEGYWLEVHCRWNVTVNPGWIIVLNFTTFNLDSTPVDGQCDERYAHIKVVDGDTSVSIFCGQNKPRTVISIGRTLIIEFFSNLEINRFFATYAAVKSDDKMLSPRFISAAPLKSTAPSVSEGLPKESVTHRQFFPCGGFLSRPSGEIYSPRFKEQPLEKRVSCQWNITVSEQWIIVLNFTYFDLDSVPMIGNMCDERYDHVSIADGEGEGRASTQLFCGQNNPGVFVSSTNKLIITFLTYFGYGRGFSASYSRVRPESSIIATVHPPRVVSASADVPSTSLQPEPPYECGGNLIGPNGAIQSPNIPEEYVSSVTCTWNITVQLGSIIELSFVTFMLDSVPINNQCDLRYAHMNIFDGKREAVHAKHVYCGQDLPGIFFSSSNTMTVEFVSNYGHGGEFYLSYMSSKAGSQLLDPRLLPVSSHPFSTQEPSQLMVTEKPTKLCGGTLNSPHGVIQFPNIFAGFQGQAINCHWTIRVQSGKVIALDFTFFNLDSVPVNNLCDEMYANVKVIDGEDARSSFKVFCGQDLPPSFVSSMNTLVIIFNDLQGYSEGFRAQYSSVTATVPISPSLNRQLLTPMTQTDASQTSCNSILKETSGVFSSPDYPNMYPADTFCSWIITTADNSRFIALKFLDFDVDNPMLEQDCSTHYSYVVVHHQNLSGREESHLFCGSHQPEIITPRAHQLIVEFYSNLGIGHGFQAAYQMYNQSEDGLQLDWSRLIEGPRDGVTTPVLSLSSTAIDGGYSEMSAPRGIVTSPNYPEQFPQGFYKTWIIRPSEGTYVTLAFEDVDFDVQTDDSYCSTLDTHVVLTIYSLEDERSDIIICQNVLSEGVISYGGLKLEFRSFFGVGRGFKARYASGMLNGDEGEDVESKPTTVPGLGVTDGRVDIKTVEWSSAIKSTITNVGTHPGESSCDELLSNTEGIIGSPNFPLSMPQDTECSWTILLPGNQGIQLEFLDFALDDQSELDSATCRQDSASVSVVMDGNLYKFCGNTVPSPMTSSGNTVGIVFKSKSGKGAGFRMHYVDASLRSTASDQPRGGTDAATTLSIPGRRASVPTNLPTASSPTQATEGETNSKSNGVTPLSITSLNVSAPESDHSDVEVRFLGNDAITDTPDDVGKDNFTRPGRERVNVPVSPPPEPATVPASPTPQQDFEFGAVATTGLDQTVSEEMSVLLPRHTDQPKVTGMGSTDPGAADITNHQLRVTTYVCVGVAVVLFIILVILTSICIYKRKQRHASKSIVLGHTEKSYWQNYKSWAADYSGGPGRSSRAATAGDIDEEGEEAEDMLKQERLV
ncbi:cubilin-like isoform X3 [Acanthaster planci]|uniref:Cubilin-like isoform X3 n=1 Tax=Acanthaster planci TaxID=133434 RepID=A0A8B7Y223_ACAPL|nr:cubilin-like isoform X3 [Acanthaster planci]